MQQLNAFIVEDEIKGLDNLKNLLQARCPNVQVTGEATTVKESIEKLRGLSQQLDVVFLDVNLPDGQAFQILDALEDVSFDIIFVTASERHAIKAFKYSSIDYILKPIDPEELVEAVQKVKPNNSKQINDRLNILRQQFRNPNAFEKVCIYTTEGIYFLHVKDIMRCQADDNYTFIYLRSGDKITSSKTIKFYEELFSELNFYRVHKTHLVNLNCMVRYVRDEGGYIIMEDGKQIEVSRRRRSEFLDYLKQFQKSHA